MNFGQIIRVSYRELQRKWDLLAEEAFHRAAPGNRDEVARGEFISAFISEGKSNTPARPGMQRPIR